MRSVVLPSYLVLMETFASEVASRLVPVLLRPASLVIFALIVLTLTTGLADRASCSSKTCGCPARKRSQSPSTQLERPHTSVRRVGQPRTPRRRSLFQLVAAKDQRLGPAISGKKRTCTGPLRQNRIPSVLKHRSRFSVSVASSSASPITVSTSPRTSPSPSAPESGQPRKRPV